MEITFQSKIAKQGDQRLIWIPKRFHDKIKDLDKTQFKTVIKNKKTKIKFVSMINKQGSNRVIIIPLFLKKDVKKIEADKSDIIIEKF